MLNVVPLTVSHRRIFFSSARVRDLELRLFGGWSIGLDKPVTLDEFHRSYHVYECAILIVFMIPSALDMWFSPVTTRP